MRDAAKKANAADNAYKKAKQNYKSAKKSAKISERTKTKADKALAKIEKQKYKDVINARAKEIDAGKSIIGKAYSKVTGSSKIQAELEYDIDKRAKVNQKWSD